jgi:hypothetical protein
MKHGMIYCQPVGQLAVAVTLTYIPEKPGSNLGRDTAYPNRGFILFPRFLHVNVRIIP